MECNIFLWLTFQIGAPAIYRIAEDVQAVHFLVHPLVQRLIGCIRAWLMVQLCSVFKCMQKFFFFQFFLSTASAQPVTCQKKCPPEKKVGKI
jgi:hypothetical protein